MENKEGFSCIEASVDKQGHSGPDYFTFRFSIRAQGDDLEIRIRFECSFVVVDLANVYLSGEVKHIVGKLDEFSYTLEDIIDISKALVGVGRAGPKLSRVLSNAMHDSESRFSGFIDYKEPKPTNCLGFKQVQGVGE